MQNAVKGRLVDQNISVREATAELLGKYVLAKPELMDRYYPMIVGRIMDTGVAVRKRVVRTLRDIIEQHPNFAEVPQCVTKIIRRVADEEGVRKLVIEAMYSLWFQISPDKETLDAKVSGCLGVKWTK